MLVTEDYDHFPIGEERNGVLILDPRGSLDLLYEQSPEAQADIAEFLLLGGPRQETLW